MVEIGDKDSPNEYPGAGLGPLTTTNSDFSQGIS
jgi:hypothetical protein